MQGSCERKDKKTKRRKRNDDCEHASWNSAAEPAEPATGDVELSSTLVNVGIDHSQDCHVKVKKKKKHKSHGLTDGQNVEDNLSDDVSLLQKEGNVVGRCRGEQREAATDSRPSSSQNIETEHQVAVASDPLGQMEGLANNTEHLFQSETLDTGKLDNDSSMTVSLSPVISQMNESSLASDEQHIKLSHSAKRRSRRRRVRKSEHRNVAGDVPNDEPQKDIVTTAGSSLPNVSGSNFSSQTSHSLGNGSGRTHIVFDSVNSDDGSHVKASPTTQLTCDDHHIQTLKDRAFDCSTAVSDGVINNTPQVETVPHLPYGSSVSAALVCSSVDKVSSTACTSVASKVRHPVKNSQFANVQVFCRQRMKKSVSATHMPNAQAADTLTSALSEQASVISHLWDLYSYCIN